MNTTHTSRHRGNDTGTYTLPSRSTYPHQWNWDSALIALGLSHFDLPRAQLLVAAWRRPPAAGVRFAHGRTCLLPRGNYERGIARDIVRAVVAVTAGTFHVGDLDGFFRNAERR